MRLTFLVLLFLSSHAVKAQKANGKITGTIHTDSSKQPVASATVSLVNAGDSTVERIIASDKKGSF
ncbi:MAG TPA: carboxypeptidase-like regulatory domain-containing protein, partial [Segetibacter sp.]